MIQSSTRTEEKPSQIVRRSAADIQALISEYEKSGMSERAFCRLRQIRRGYFKKWLVRYGGKAPRKGFVPVTLPEALAGKEPSGLFAEYRGIKFYQKVDPSSLKSLLS